MCSVMVLQLGLRVQIKVFFVDTLVRRPLDILEAGPLLSGGTATAASMLHFLLRFIRISDVGHEGRYQRSGIRIGN